jgi:glucosamine kinase
MSANLTPSASHAAAPGLGLGLDAGGTQTRWALADASGLVVAEGSVAPISGLQMDSEAGRAEIAAALRDIAAALASQTPVGVLAGITGFDAAAVPQLCALAAEAFNVTAADVRAMSDIELACHAAFAPGQGYVVYAGTGSVAAYVDASGALQRAGGRGVVIDDAGGGHWIAREALRHIWRAEDEAPGSWQQSALAARVFERVGGSDWAHTRAWVYGASRGELGTLALAVAEAAQAPQGGDSSVFPPHADPAALAILQAAGRELARLALALVGRHGAKPIALAGRVFELHPAIENALRAELPTNLPMSRLTQPAHHAAARLAARTP